MNWRDRSQKLNGKFIEYEQVNNELLEKITEERNYQKEEPENLPLNPNSKEL